VKFRPLHDRVLVLPDGAAPKTVGLAAPPSQKEEPTQGVVVAAGPEALKVKLIPHLMGQRVEDDFPATWGGNPEGVAVGERVQWAKYAGREVEHDGRKHRLLRLEEIDGVLEEE